MNDTPQLSKDERISSLQALVAAGLTFGEVVSVMGEKKENSPYVAAAIEMSREGELEVDDCAVVSRGDDEGSYVSAWLWVPGLLDDEPGDDETVDVEAVAGVELVPTE